MYCSLFSLYMIFFLFATFCVHFSALCSSFYIFRTTSIEKFTHETVGKLHYCPSKPILKDKLLFFVVVVAFIPLLFRQTHMHTIHYIAILFFSSFFSLHPLHFFFIFVLSSFSPLMVKLVNGFGLVSGLCVILIFYVWPPVQQTKKNALCYVIVVVYVWVWDIAYLLLLLVTSTFFSVHSFIPRIWKFADFFCYFFYFICLISFHYCTPTIG